MFEEVLSFWFNETDPAQRWKKDAAFDQLIAERFTALLESAARCELYAWRLTPQGRLAEIIVLDQFSRNIYRNQPAAFAHDAVALALAQAAVEAGALTDLSPDRRQFLLMPYMHSESLAIHDAAATLFNNHCEAATIEFAKRHRDIIARFGRYPHRNAILDRPSTAEELDFLQAPGSSF